MEWRHPNSPRTKKFKAQKFAGKIMATVFWDSQGVILVDIFPKRQTINSEVDIETLRKLKAKNSTCLAQLGRGKCAPPA